MREGATRAEAGDGSALPAVIGPPVDNRPAHQRSAQVSGRPRLDRQACRWDRRGCAGGAGERRRRAGERAAGRPLEDGDGGLAVGQIVERLPCVARRVHACPAHQHAERAVAQLLHLVLLHLVLGRAVGAKNRRRPPYLACSALRMRRAVDERSAQRRVQARPEGASEARVAVRDETLGSPTTGPRRGTRSFSSAVAVLKVGTSLTRPVRRSMCTCRKSWQERAKGSSRKFRLMHPPRRVETGRRYSRPSGGRWSTLTR